MKTDTTPMTDKELIFEITSAFTAALVEVLPPDTMKRMMNEINFAFMRYTKEREEPYVGQI